MAALTLRLSDDKLARLKVMARRRGISVNRLVEEMTTLALVEFDAETRFRARAERGRGKVRRGLRLLAKASRPTGSR
ncbi:ribbon-helix-helix protein, CopG family [Reyranella sp.]|uniref:ribbon-helix-helix protein, CopG family n=1 Tax=Reyranella sp. TaxID=1929291 RepID=UPI002F93CFBC